MDEKKFSIHDLLCVCIANMRIERMIGRTDAESTGAFFRLLTYSLIMVQDDRSVAGAKCFISDNTNDQEFLQATEEFLDSGKGRIKNIEVTEKDLESAKKEFKDALRKAIVEKVLENALK